ncbi:Transcriptional regulator, AraC family [Actinokineospora spheciospongiae]|uniref:Transcriptional regulator, AraC family n=1 Tax=Actinokineospora spheciospongiae TaxID=909613 RepID=W7IWY4_9PSEU|nr:helix-turn-helix transcriptional regulator [Actinokineospora spheciospongiae]EWC61317.1 Transcriptional regulator, AraC family [Actinokineospora spheciospongiae]
MDAGWSLVVARRDVERAPAERVFATPHPSLADHVLTYTAHDFPDSEAFPWRIAPLGAVTVTIDLAAPPLRRTPGGADFPASPVMGLRDRPLVIEQGGANRGIIVALTPAGAHALFGLPLKELANAVLPLSDLLGNTALLTEQLAEAPDWRTCFTTLDTHLGTHLRTGPEFSRPIRGALHLLTAKAPTRVAAVADEIGWTRQHLSTRFREQVGLTPKAVARIARLHRAVTLLNHPSAPPLAEVAHRCGYTDQPHLNRDFRALTGCTPTEYR